jgi:hypothetical protein
MLAQPFLVQTSFPHFRTAFFPDRSALVWALHFDASGSNLNTL